MSQQANVRTSWPTLHEQPIVVAVEPQRGVVEPRERPSASGTSRISFRHGALADISCGYQTRECGYRAA